MASFGANEVSGHIFELARTDPRHYTGRNESAARAGGLAEAVETEASETSAAQSDFSNMLFNSLEDVNDLQQSHEELSVQSIINPDSVDPHDVTLAAAKANLSLSITKSVVDRVLQAYREISNLR
ncbi:MAG: flagellar hook-basal body complex protein FliE [Spirochaetes bacterium]|jgi:flagellar hook-basal body complex protein FliE|nr:flagellar hook-basal body complex protein FliE [Spirochaetota bacterium]